MARVKMSGLDKLNRKLYRLPQAAKDELAKAMEAGAKEIVALAKTLVPVGKSPPTYAGSNNPNALKNSINWTWGEAPKGSIVLGTIRPSGNSKADDLKITIYAGDDEAFYARWVEFGTRSHGIDAKANNPGGMSRGQNNFGRHVDHPGAKATPFFFPAYRASRKRVRARLSKAITTSVKKVAKSG